MSAPVLLLMVMVVVVLESRLEGLATCPRYPGRIMLRLELLW